MTACRHFPDYPHCVCDSVSCVMLRSPANPAGLESIGGTSDITAGTWAERDEAPCERKLARLLEVAERIVLYDGDLPPETIRRALRAAIAEARKS